MSYRSTSKSRGFRESTDQIPTPGVQVTRPRRYVSGNFPRFLHPFLNDCQQEPIVLKVTTVVFMLTVTLALAIALEVGLALSNAHNGAYSRRVKSPLNA